MSADRRSAGGEQRDGVDLTNLDEPLTAMPAPPNVTSSTTSKRSPIGCCQA